MASFRSIFDEQLRLYERRNSKLNLTNKMKSNETETGIASAFQHWNDASSTASVSCTSEMDDEESFITAVSHYEGEATRSEEQLLQQQQQQQQRHQDEEDDEENSNDGDSCCSSSASSCSSSSSMSSDCSSSNSSSWDGLAGLDELMAKVSSIDCENNASNSDKANGLILTMNMVQNLRKTTSGGNLMEALSTLTNTEDAQLLQGQGNKNTPRRNSAGDAANRLTHAVQTGSPMESRCVSDDTPKPVTVLQQILQAKGLPYKVTPAKDGSLSWVRGDVASYTMELMQAVRNNDMDKIRELKHKNHNFQCCNKFGESILHAIARHGRTELLRYLVEQAGVSMVVCCDGGRTILHDACWTGQPNFATITFILQNHPEFLCVADQRGFTPLEYAPRDTHDEWQAYLLKQSLSDLVVSRK